MTKHKHADLIHAWADGAEIQILSKDGEWRAWPHPHWGEDFEYRIKPEEKKPVVKWLWADKYGTMTGRLFTEEEISKFMVPRIKLEWSRTEFPE